MVIDFHTHVFPEKMVAGAVKTLEEKSGVPAKTNGCIDGLLASMKEAGVTRSIVLPVVTAPKQFSGINRFAASINEEYSDCLTSFGGIHPDSEDYKAQLKFLRDEGFVGIKLHPDYQGVMFNDIRYKRIVDYASELDMVIQVHAGVDIGLPEPVHCTPKMALEVISETGAKKLVLAHLGGWKLWDEVEESLAGRDVYFDTAFIEDYIDRQQFERIVKTHGSDRVLFATDSPWSGQKESIDWINACDLDDETKEKIFYKNAKKLLGI
ncbi:MAG: amidohydrolase family protein [Lachnospiraceae bacterium]|nr:amidohydrolase family protein [Lachnospiraceae bacterium]